MRVARAVGCVPARSVRPHCAVSRPHSPETHPPPTHFCSHHSTPTGIFEVVDASPPPRSLGEHALPPDTHNGDRIEAAGGAWVVQRTALHYRLVRGRYVRHAARVEVVSAGRYLVERYLTGLMEGSPAEER